MAEVDKTYKVYMTPLVDSDVYGTEIEITEFVQAPALNSIKTNTDSDNNTIGDYLLGTISLTCTNYNGEFNEDDPRSLFPFKRDDAKVRVVYFDGLTDSSGSFKGLVTDEATKANEDNETVTIRVLALDSILRKVQVQGGLVDNGDLFSAAIKALLNVTAITSILTYDPANIEVDLDLTIDDSSAFTSISTWDAIRQLLIASNSVIYVDDETVKVSARDKNTGEISYFYGPGDTLDRENFIGIKEYNNGAHRIFNSVMVNDTVYNDDTSVNWFGLKQKSFTFDFITDTDKETLIAKQLVNQFRYPKIEFMLTCSTQLANQIEFFDTIGVSHPIRSRPYRTTDAALYGVGKYGTAGDVYPVSFGALQIPGRFAFQIIQRIENPSKFETTLKLRQRGKTFDDGTLIFWNSVYDFAVYGSSTYA
jgi:hypothetical protein